MAVEEKVFQSYMKNPSDHFESPIAVTFSSELSAEQKREILKSWKLDEKELLVAADENMGTADGEVLSKVDDAISRLLGGKTETE